MYMYMICTSFTREPPLPIYIHTTHQVSITPLNLHPTKRQAQTLGGLRGDLVKTMIENDSDLEEGGSSDEEAAGGDGRKGSRKRSGREKGDSGGSSKKRRKEEKRRKKKEKRKKVRIV